MKTNKPNKLEYDYFLSGIDVGEDGLWKDVSNPMSSKMKTVDANKILTSNFPRLFRRGNRKSWKGYNVGLGWLMDIRQMLHLINLELTKAKKTNNKYWIKVNSIEFDPNNTFKVWCSTNIPADSIHSRVIELYHSKFPKRVSNKCSSCGKFGRVIQTTVTAENDKIWDGVPLCHTCENNLFEGFAREEFKIGKIPNYIGLCWAWSAVKNTDYLAQSRWKRIKTFFKILVNSY